MDVLHFFRTLICHVVSEYVILVFYLLIQRKK